ncbi:MAG: histidine kinase [Firmicutes bacterium]|nr:histidine kinase [Bacillota bacterium]
MRKSRYMSIILPLLPALLVMLLLLMNAAAARSSFPTVRDGVLDLSAWDYQKTGAFNLEGEWEFYWDRSLSRPEIESGREQPGIIEAPGLWTDYELDGQELPAFGQATYRAHVVHAPVGQRFAIRVQNQASAYRLYIDDYLIAQNGDFGDTAGAPVSRYRPQFTEFTPERDSFDIILQVSNSAYAVGGMWDWLMFGLAEPMSFTNNAVKVVVYISIGSLLVMCLFFAIMFAVVRKEKELLVICAIGLLVMVRYLESGNMIITHLLPGMPIAGFGWIDYLTGVWSQFFLLYFVYLTYSPLVNRWLVRILLAYSILASIAILTLPFEIVASTYLVMSLLFLLVLTVIVVVTARAAYEYRTGSRSLLAAMAFILFSMFYELWGNDPSITYFLINCWVLDFTVLFLVQCSIVARRYRETQRLELGLLKSQIRPHFVHNSLASIISISRRDSERARELLVDFSSYLRGCYDYEGDDMVPLEQELEFVRAYVALEQARFGEKFKVEYQVEASNVLVPPLILQPLVENAFIHGLREKEAGGTVVVYARRDKNDRLRLGVADDGIGMNARPKSPVERQGIGISNINQRLARLFNTRLVFSVPEGGGCEVFMEIPYREVDCDAGYAY